MSETDDSGRAADDGIGTVSHFEAQRDEQVSLAEKRRREVIRSAFEDAHQALAVDDVDEVQRIIGNDILPQLDVTTSRLSRYRRRLEDRGIDVPVSALRLLISDDVSDGELDNLDEVLEALEAIASVDGPLPSTLQTKQPVVEYRHQIGERYLSGGQPVSNRLESIDPDDDLKATLFTGGQGSGKSTSLETIIEDRVARGHKIIDLVDFYKSENATYDVADQSDLAELRDEMGLSTGFEDYDPPTVEVLAPLSRDLSETQVPVREDGESVVKPFSIPASELTYRQLVMLLPHTTKTHENYLRSAHQKLDSSGKDWGLKDVARVVRNETNAGEKVSDRIERALQTAQSKSFIRDKQCEHALEWDEIMADAGTVTAFTTHMIREPTDQLLITSYLLDCVYDERKRLLRERKIQEFPTMTVAMRELHNVAPRLKSEQDSEKTIEGYMIDTMSELISLMRHVNMEIVADTQKFRQQLSPQVSGLFHRVFCFRGQKPDIRKVFKTRVNPAGNPEQKISQFDDGVCALVSDDGYSMPIRFAPPRCHHLDASTDGDGLSFRARTRDDEQLEPAPWDTSVPERLEFEGAKKDPVQEFYDKFVTRTAGQDRLFRKELVSAYESWAEEHGHNVPRNGYLYSRLRDRYDIDKNEDEGKTSAGKRYFKGLVLNGPSDADANPQQTATSD